MASTAPTNEPDWSEPATKGDLLLSQTSLEGKIKDLRVEMVNMDRRLSGEIAGLRASMAWVAVGVVTTLGGLITLFEFIS